MAGPVASTECSVGSDVGPLPLLDRRLLVLHDISLVNPASDHGGG